MTPTPKNEINQQYPKQNNNKSIKAVKKRCNFYSGFANAQACIDVILFITDYLLITMSTMIKSEL